MSPVKGLLESYNKKYAVTNLSIYNIITFKFIDYRWI